MSRFKLKYYPLSIVTQSAYNATFTQFKRNRVICARLPVDSANVEWMNSWVKFGTDQHETERDVNSHFGVTLGDAKCKDAKLQADPVESRFAFHVMTEDSFEQQGYSPSDQG